MDDEDIEETDFIEDVEEDQEDNSPVLPGAPEGASDLEEEEVVEADAALEKYKECFDQSFDKVEFPADTVAAVQQTWQAFLAHAGSQEAAGEVLFNAWWEAAPSLHSAFVSPQKVLHLRLFLGFNAVIASLGNPLTLKIEVEQIAFRHLNRPVKPAFVDIFREALLEMFEAELTAAHFTARARVGWQALLNYLGGAFCYVSREYSGRVKIILRSWRTANNVAEEKEKDPDAEEEEDEADEEEKEEEAAVTPVAKSSSKEEVTSEAGRPPGDGINLKERTGKDMKVPTTFKEMFLFNAAVMGFGNSNWMSLILDQFDAMVMNIANSHRLSEECDVLSLVLAKEDEASIHLVEFRSVMLATLRSLCPKDWDTDHEVAWNWLWENIERMLKALWGKPRIYQHALDLFIAGLSDEEVDFFRRELYKRFFLNAPAGQDHFKQSTTRLYFLADRVVETTSDMFKRPRKMVQEISGLGLRHVGYGIPTEMFSPYVSAAVDTVAAISTDDNALAGFRWSLTLVAKILVRAVGEGATLVMRAINTNQELAMRKALAIAPRGQRAMELLNISVGTQSISPLFWAIQSGALHSARAMIVDLLTIRADRDVYYYGCDELFTRHPDIIHRLCKDAPTLLWTLLDGLLWRSRLTFQAQRRVNYYVKHLVQDLDGKSSQTLSWLAAHQDPKVIVHPVVVMFADLIWSRLAMYHFLLGRCYFLFAVCVFVTSQAVLFRHDGSESMEENIARFACRCFLYLASMPKLMFDQCRMLAMDLQARDLRWIGCIPTPRYLWSLQHAGTFLLAILLIIMFVQEPIFWCGVWTINEKGPLIFTQICEESRPIRNVYSIVSCFAMLLYWALLMDFTLFSMRISAFVLVCGQVLADVGLFALALVFLVMAFATAISSLKHGIQDFSGVDPWLAGLLQMALGMFPRSDYDQFEREVAVLVSVAVFVAIVSVFLLNLLIAQLSQSYHDVFEDMQGFARLNRAGTTAATLTGIRAKNWNRFLEGLGFEERLEFNEGDVGLAGGIQVTEPANANLVTEDAIRRYGGSTAPTMPWPQEHEEPTEEDRFDRLERLISRSSKAGSRSKGRVKGSSSQEASSTSDK